MSERTAVCSVEELPPGAMKLVELGAYGVGVYNVGGSFYAIANFCTHEGAPLCAGFVGGTNEFDPDEPGGLRRAREGRIVRCPWHQWEFDITTGENLANPRKRVRTYDVAVVDGKVYVTA